MHHSPDFLQALWFILLGILWTGFFVLEGFDFGVGMLVRGLGRDQVQKRMIIHTIGPVWDGNEVWLIVAGAGTFAAFPQWYASTFSGFYLALFLVVVAIVARGVSFEFWGKVDSPRWRATWEWTLAIASGAAALLFGVAWADFVQGVPMNAAYVVHASLWDLLHPYALLGGLTFVALFLTHGAIFLTLRTKGQVADRARKLARRTAPLAALLTIAFLIWTCSDQSWGAAVVVLSAIAVALVLLTPALLSGGTGRAFATSVGTIVVLMVALLAALYPNALPSTTNHAFDLTLAAASSTSYTLTVMTVVAIIFVPIVLLYQGWTYWVFRHRLGRDDFEGPFTPMAVLERHPVFGAKGVAGTDEQPSSKV